MADAKQDRGLIYEAIVEAFGEPCLDNEEGCPCCDAWAQFDAFTLPLDTVRAENAKLRAALELWHLATKIDVTMEGPQYMGVSYILGRQAWERTRAALGGEK